MANGVDFTYTIGTRIDTRNLIASINKVQQDLNKQPLSVQIKGDISARVSDIANFANVIGTTTDKIESVKVVYQEFYDKLNSSKLTVPVREIVTFKNEVGNSVTKVRELETELAAIAKSDKKGFEFLGSTTAVANIGKASSEIQKQFNSMDKSVSSASKSAEDFLAKTKSMSGPSVDAGRALAQQIQITAEKYEDLKDAGDIAGATKLKESLDGDRKSLGLINEALNRGAVGLQNFGASIQRVLKQSVLYGLAMRAMRMAMQELNNAIRYTVDLNTEMTKIGILQVEGAKTTAEIDRLANSFNRLAQEMGATTLQVAQGSVEWLRQGKTIEETSRLLKSTLMLSKLGNMEAADATEKLTSTLNGYKMEASEAVSVVDKLVAVDNVAATSVKELTTALQYSAAVAEQTGVSFEQLVSYIGVVSETTRQNAESIGQGMKTMLTRMQDIKGGKLDEDGLGINNVEIALRKANIELRDSKSSFRDFGTVLEELAGEWDTLSETEQAFISKSIAGVRQVNMFTVLMTNMNRALELQNVQFTSAGLASSRYQLYMESLEAKIAQFRATLEGLYQDAIESGFIGSLVESGINILKIIEKTGGLEAALKRLTVAYIALRLAMKVISSKHGLDTLRILGLEIAKMVSTAGSAKAAIAGLGTKISALAKTITTISSVTGVWLITIGAVIAGAIALEKVIVTQKEAYEALIDAQEKATELGEQISSVEELKKQYDELRIAAQDNTKTQEEQIRARQQLDDVIDQLAEKLPGLTKLYGKEGESIGILSTSYAELAENLKTARAEAEALAKVNAEQFLFNQTGGGMGAQSFQYSDTAKLEQLYRKANRTQDSDDWNEYYKKLGEYGEAFSKVGAEGAASFIETLNAGIDDNITQNLIEMAHEVAAAEEQYIQDSWEKRYQDHYDMIFRQNLGVQGANETQIDSRMKFGTDKESGQDYIDYLITERIPALNEGIFKLKDSFEILSNGKLITGEQKAELESLGIIVTANKDNIQELFYEVENAAGELVTKAIRSSDDFADVLLTVLENTEITDEGILSLAERFFRLSASEQDAELSAYKLEAQMKATADAAKDMQDEADAVSGALLEQSENGSFSVDMAFKLISANGELGSMLERVGDGYRFTADSISADTVAKMENFLKTEIMTYSNLRASDALISLQRGEYMTAAAQLVRAAATDAETAAVQNLLGILNLLDSWSSKTVYTPSSSSGTSAKQEDPRIKENEELIEQIEDQIELEEDKIDVYEEEIDLIKKAQDEYHDWIDQKKKSLELTKEESDYFKEQQKSLKELADIRKEIALLELDTSEEATAKRLELEAQAAEMEAEIAEDAEERRFDLQMEALDSLQDSFDKMIETQIEGIENVIKSIEDGIDILRDRIEDIRDLIADIRDSSRSGSGTQSQYPYNGGLGVGMQTFIEGGSVTVTNPEVTDGDLYSPSGVSPYITQYHPEGPVDIRTRDRNDPNVYAPQSGTVIAAGMNGGYGNTIAIKDADGRITTTSHLGTINVEIGQEITAKDIIGTIGSTWSKLGGEGTWTGTGDAEHIHFEVWEETEEGLRRVKVGLDDFSLQVSDSTRILNESVKSTSVALNEGSITIRDSSGNVDKSLTGAANMWIDQNALSAQQMSEVVQLTADSVLTWGGNVDTVTARLADLGYSVNLAGDELIRFYRFMESLQRRDINVELTQGEILDLKNNNINPPEEKDNPIQAFAFHSGGLALPDDRSDFIGNLRSNEVFAKLLKGEYVSTEGQMDNFLKNILPKVTLGYQAFTKNNQIPSITVNMPITVEGNMDKDVIPDIKKISNNVMEEINRSLILRGYVRPANNTLS